MTDERRLSDHRNVVSGLYTLDRTIGRGHFAVVKLARHVFTQKEVAVKVIDKTKLDELSKAHLFQEVVCMKLVQHPNVVRLYEVIDTPNKLYLILELGDGGDMYDYIMKYANGLNENMARRYFRQICRALNHCHKMHICHRDLKPENLVFFEKQGIVKLTDFGFSNQFLPGKELFTSCGSLAYSAPEILLGDPYNAEAVDIWSLGVILFMFVSGHAPFQEANDSETVQAILDCCYIVPQYISTECQNLIRRIIVKEPEQRATLEDIMNDVWYKNQMIVEDDLSDDDDYISSLSLISHKTISNDYNEKILQEMVNGNISEREEILNSLNENQYNHITATYYLLAEKLLYNQLYNDNDKENIQKKRRKHLLPTNQPFTEQISIFLTPTSTNYNSSDDSKVSKEFNDGDDDMSDIEEWNLIERENVLTLPQSSEITIPRLTPPESQLALMQDDEDRLNATASASQSRLSSVRDPSTQAMNIIPEEDEYSESPTDKASPETNLPLLNISKLNKIIESEEESDDFDRQAPKIVYSATNKTNETLNYDSTFELPSTDLSSIIGKSLNSSRSHSSVDSEDDSNDNLKNKQSHQSPTMRPNSLQDNDSRVNHSQYRGRSWSNVEHVLNLHLLATSLTGSSQFGDMRRSSLASNNRLTINGGILGGSNNDNNTNISSTSILTNRTRSLSMEHRLANQSQMSIASRTSTRFSTPRESIVFTKMDTPPVIRLLQAQSHDNESLRSLIEHRRQSTQSHQEHTPIIEKDAILRTNVNNTIPATTANTVLPTITASATKTNVIHNRSGNTTLFPTKSNVIVPAITNVNGNSNNSQDYSSSSSSPQQKRSVLYALGQSLINYKHHTHQKSDIDGDKIKHEHSADHIKNTNSINEKRAALMNDDSSDKRHICCTVL